MNVHANGNILEQERITFWLRATYLLLILGFVIPAVDWVFFPKTPQERAMGIAEAYLQSPYNVDLKFCANDGADSVPCKLMTPKAYSGPTRDALWEALDAVKYVQASADLPAAEKADLASAWDAFQKMLASNGVMDEVNKGDTSPEFQTTRLTRAVVAHMMLCRYGQQEVALDCRNGIPWQVSAALQAVVLKTATYGAKYVTYETGKRAGALADAQTYLELAAK